MRPEPAWMRRHGHDPNGNCWSGNRQDRDIRHVCHPADPTPLLLPACPGATTCSGPATPASRRSWCLARPGARRQPGSARLRLVHAQPGAQLARYRHRPPPGNVEHMRCRRTGRGLGCSACLTVVPAACGGDDSAVGRSTELVWSKAPRVAVPPTLPRDRILRGEVKNEGLKSDEVKAADVQPAGRRRPAGRGPGDVHRRLRALAVPLRARARVGAGPLSRARSESAWASSPC